MEDRFKELLPTDVRMKYEVAEELGLLDKIKEKGWKGLTAKETGRIGGILRAKYKEQGAKKE